MRCVLLGLGLAAYPRFDLTVARHWPAPWNDTYAGDLRVVVRTPAWAAPRVAYVQAFWRLRPMESIPMGSAPWTTALVTDDHDTGVNSTTLALSGVCGIVRFVEGLSSGWL